MKTAKYSDHVHQQRGKASCYFKQHSKTTTTEQGELVVTFGKTSKTTTNDNKKDGFWLLPMEKYKNPQRI